MNTEVIAVLIVVSVVTALAKHGLIDDKNLSQEEANAVFDSISKDIVAILSE
jgi:hypothetical protein